MHIPPPLDQSSMLHLRILGPLMLMFLSCDAVSACSSDENPLELIPPEVIAEYSETESFLVNCTSSEEYHDGLKWKIGDKLSSEEELKTFILQEVPLSDWSVKATCTVKVEDTECSKELGITIYKMPDIVSVSASDHGPMEEGKAYSLKCDIRNVAPVKNLKVKWHKGNETVYTVQFNDTSVTPLDVSSHLTFTAKRDDNGAVYGCSAELHLGPNGPELIPNATSLPYAAVVFYKPQVKTCPVQYSGVEHGFSLDKLPCQVDGNPPPIVEWSYQGGLISASEPLDRTHSGYYTAEFKNPYGSDLTSVNITIEYPPSFACDAHYEVQEDSKSQTVCEPEGVPQPATTWFKDGEKIETPQRWTKKDSGIYILNATNKHGTVQHELTVDVLYKPQVKTCPVQYSGVEHGFSLDKLPCQVDGNPPPTVEWSYQGGLINASEPLDRTHSGYYTAEFKNPYGSDLISVNITIEYPPSFACNDHYEVQEDSKPQTVCEPEGVPQPATTWFKDGEEIETPQRWTKKDSGIYILNATNKHGTVQHELTVDVLYAPELKNKTEEAFVSEGANVTLTCEAEGNPPPDFMWTLDGGNILESTNTIIIPQVLTSTTYNCTASNYLGSVTKQIRVHVIRSIRRANPAPMTTTEAPAQRDCSLTLMPAEAVVRFGDKISVNCSTSSKVVSAMGWEATIEAARYKNVSVITWTVEKVEVWTLRPMCYLNQRGGRQCFEIANITVYKIPDIVSVSALDHGPMEEGKAYSLKCDVRNVSPVKNLKVKWYRGNEMVKTEQFNDVGVNPGNVSSLLTFTAERDDNGAVYGCSAELHLGPNGPEVIPNATSLPYTAVVFYKPQVKTCPVQYSGVEHDFSLDKLPCQVDGNPPPTVEWSYQGGLINASQPLDRTQSGLYKVEFKNDYGINLTFVDITIEYPPSFACNDHYEVQEYSKSQTVCEPEGVPQPATTWFKDGEEIETPQHWMKKDSGIYILNATNKHGTVQHVLTVDVLYAPVFKEKNYSMEVTTGENVTLECLAEGNPPPEVRWIYTPAENVNVSTTGGRQKNISVTGATSTNAGAYICVATNKVGRVSRSVTLILKGKTSGFPTVIIWVLIILLILIISVIIYCSRKKHGKYDFVPDRPIPMSATGGVYA